MEMCQRNVLNLNSMPSKGVTVPFVRETRPRTGAEVTQRTQMTSRVRKQVDGLQRKRCFFTTTTLFMSRSCTVGAPIHDVYPSNNVSHITLNHLYFLSVVNFLVNWQIDHKQWCVNSAWLYSDLSFHTLTFSSLLGVARVCNEPAGWLSLSSHSSCAAAGSNLVSVAVKFITAGSVNKKWLLL